MKRILTLVIFLVWVNLYASNKESTSPTKTFMQFPETEGNTHLISCQSSLPTPGIREMKNSISPSTMVTVSGNSFILNGKNYTYIGANYWYGGLLAAVNGKAGRQRLIKELNFMKTHGITNLRALVGAEGAPLHAFRVPYSLQPGQGRLDDNLLKSLDFFISEAGKRNIKLVLYLTNNWDWSGGLGQYLYWNGYPLPPVPGSENYWNRYLDYATQFYTCEPCITELESFIKSIITRKNSINGKIYRDDPTIMAWEIANEPRPMSARNSDAFRSWLHSTAAYIKSLDRNHLVTTGSEGDIANDYRTNDFIRDHNSADIDYLTIHVWPRNWGWFSDTSIVASFPRILENSSNYIARHIKIADSLHKPLVIEEFGLPRDQGSLKANAPAMSRDRYYAFMFGLLLKSSELKGIAGANFWGMGGFAKPSHTIWQKGDDFTNDPGQDEQGLNSVFVADSSTWTVIKRFSNLVNRHDEK